MNEITLECAAEASALGGLMQGVAEFFDVNGLPPGAMMPFELAVEELFANVVTHATRAAGSPLRVWLVLSTGAGAVSAEFTDDGPPFDPTLLDTPDTSLDAMDRQIGGLGLHLIKTMMDGVEYTRLDGRNCLRFHKNL